MNRERVESLILVATSLAAATATALWSLAPNLRATFGPIDDHEPLGWLGQDGRLSLLEAVQILLYETEIGEFGAAMRFRPAYYSFRIGQTVLFTDHPTAWYASVFVLFIVACSAMGLSLAWWLRLAFTQTATPVRFEFGFTVVAAFIYTILLSSISAWSGIVTRLGPSELLGATMVALAILAATALLAGKHSGWWAVLIVGVWGAVFSKEVLLPLAFLPALVAFGVARDHLRSLTRFWLAILGALPAVVLTIAVVPPLLAGTSSAYGSRQDVSRIAGTLEGLFRVLPSYWAPAALVAGMSVAVFTVTHRNSQRRVALTVAGAFGLTMLWFLFDAFIYYGSYELPRYGLNWQLIKIVWVAGAVALSVSLLINVRRWWSGVVGGVILGLSGLIVLFGILGAPQQLDAMRRAAMVNASNTSNFQTQLDVVRNVLQEDRDLRVAIIVDQPIDYEPVRALAVDLENYAQTDAVAILNQRSPALHILREMDLPISNVVPPDELADGGWVCVYLRPDPVAVDQCPAERTFVVETWSM